MPKLHYVFTLTFLQARETTTLGSIWWSLPWSHSSQRIQWPWPTFLTSSVTLTYIPHLITGLDPHSSAQQWPLYTFLGSLVTLTHTPQLKSDLDPHSLAQQWPWPSFLNSSVTFTYIPRNLITGLDLHSSAQQWPWYTSLGSLVTFTHIPQLRSDLDPHSLAEQWPWPRFLVSTVALAYRTLLISWLYPQFKANSLTLIHSSVGHVSWRMAGSRVFRCERCRHATINTKTVMLWANWRRTMVW